MMSVRRIMPGLAALAFSATSLVASVARADAGPGDAWAAAKTMLPANPYVVGGMNVATIKGSTIFQQLYPKLVAQAGEAKQGLDALKQDCGIDAKEAIQGVVISVDEKENGFVVLALKGVDKPKVEDCLKKYAAKEKKEMVTNGPDANGVIEYAEKGAPTHHFFVAYKGNGVMALAADKAQLAGKGIGTGSVAAAALSKVNPTAALWGVVAKSQELDKGMNMKVGYGSADIVGENITADLRVVLANAKEAGDAATKANGELEKAKKGGQIPPAMANVVSSLKISAAGDELVVKAQMAQKEALQMIGMAMGGGATPQ